MVLTQDEIGPNLERVPEFVDRAIQGALAFQSPQAENYAKKNAPWTDRTTNARNGLIAKSGKESDRKSVV